MSETQISFRLQVWQNSRLKGVYIDSNSGKPVDMSVVYSPVYSWESPYDILASVADRERIDQLREALFDTFSIERTHQERNIKQVTNTLKLLDEVLSIPEQSSWMDAEETTLLANEERVNLRYHPLLAFREHLQWIYDTFSNMPDTSITIR
jgi:hypothetical protein